MMVSPNGPTEQGAPQLQMEKLLVDLNARLDSLDQKLNSTFTAIQLTSVNNVKQSEDTLRQMMEALERRHEQSIKNLSDKQDNQLDALVNAVVQDDRLAQLFSKKLAEAERHKLHKTDITATSGLKLADAPAQRTSPASLQAKTPDTTTTDATAAKKPKAATVEDGIDNDSPVSVAALRTNTASASCGETNGASKPVDSSSQSGKKVHNTSSTANGKQKTAATTADRTPNQKKAVVDYATVPRFIDGESFERYLAKVDRLWYGNKDASYRATLCECIRTDPHQPVSNWIKRTDPDFIAEADWPDFKGSLKELFSPGLTTVGDYCKWAKTMTEVAPDFFHDPFGQATGAHAAEEAECGAAECGCEDHIMARYWASLLARTTLGSQMGLGTDPSRGSAGEALGAWGSSLSEGNLSGAFKSPASTSSTAPVSRSKDSAENKPPPPSYDQATDANTLSAASSAGQASEVREARTSSNSEDGACARTEAGPSRLGDSTATLQRKDGKASSAATKTKAKAVSDVDAMVKTLPQFDGNAEGFYDWTRQVDHIWYTIRDIEAQRAFLLALSKTFAGRARTWLSLSDNTWLEHTEWPDWRANMATFLGDTMFNAREEPSHVVVYPRPMRVFEDRSRVPVIIDEVPLAKRRFK